MATRGDAKVDRALALYRRLLKVQRQPMSDVTVVRVRALTRRIVSFLDVATPRQTDQYYAGAIKARDEVR